jgi:Ca-activated chloride channel family protein
MTLLTPLALLGGAVVVPIVLMYVLKLRRREHPVSSTLLWRRALDDVQANAPWQRLRPNILLLLQLLVMAAIVLALARPAYSRSHAFAGDLILVVDQSYGMQAADVRPSRFAAALTEARSLASSVGSGNVVSVVGMGAQPTLAIAESADQGAVSSAIDTLKVSASPPNYLAALSLAVSLARGGEHTQAIILTSRDSGISGLPLQVPFPVEVRRLGGHLRDLGLTAFQAARQGRTTSAVLRVANFGVKTVFSDLDLYVDGRLADVRPISVRAGRELPLFWSNLPGGARSLEARLTVRDDISADKAAWTVIAGGSTRSVLLITSGDYFLQTALTLDPSVRLTVARPSAYSVTAARGYDLVAFDGVLPARLPAASTLLVAPPRGRVGQLQFGSTVGLKGQGVIAAPGVTSSLLQYVDLSEVHVAQARSATLPGWLQPVVTAGATLLLSVGDDGNRRVAVFAFNLQESDWPLRISFPIAVQNTLRYLAPTLTVGTSNLTAGQPLKLYPQPGTREIDIVRPDHHVDRFHPPFAPYAATARPGLYLARALGRGPEADAPFVVNFFPSRAAAASGPDVLRFGAQNSGSTRVVSVPVSVAWAFGLAALALLATEWWFAFRR